MRNAGQGKKVVVLGGTGFIGGALCRDLVGAGYAVVALTRRPRPDGEGISYRVWDGRTAEGWADAVDGARAVINLAGESIAGGRWDDLRKEAILSSRVQAGLAVTEAVERAAAKPAVLVQGSATGYYGDRPSDEILDEAAAPGQGFLAEVCRQWEDSSRAVEDMGVRRVVVRTGVVLGRGGGALKSMLPSFRLFAGGWPGSGRQGMPWIHLLDEVGAIRFLMDTDRVSGPVNLCAPTRVTAKAFCQALGEVLGRPCWLPMPAPVLRAALGEMADELLLAGAMVSSGKLGRAGYVFRFPDVRAALRDSVQEPS